MLLAEWQAVGGWDSPSLWVRRKPPFPASLPSLEADTPRPAQGMSTFARSRGPAWENMAPFPPNGGFSPKSRLMEGLGES